jgi:predicted RNase H-like nuclease (RuvC/YqgF family)
MKTGIEKTAEQEVAEILRDNLHFSGQINGYLITGAIEKLIEWRDKYTKSQYESNFDKANVWHQEYTTSSLNVLPLESEKGALQKQSLELKAENERLNSRLSDLIRENDRLKRYLSDAEGKTAGDGIMSHWNKTDEERSNEDSGTIRHFQD